MASLAMVFFGAFVGAVIGRTMRRIEDWTSPQKILAAIIGTATTGSIMSLFDYFGGRELSDALFFYPVGLIPGFAAMFIRDVQTNIESSNTNTKIFGWLQAVGYLLLLIFVILVLFSPLVRELLPT